MKSAFLKPRATLALALGLLGQSSSAPALFTFPVEGSLAGVNASSNRNDTGGNLKSTGGQASLSLGPVWAASAKQGLRFTPTYDFDYSGVNAVLKVEEEQLLFSQQMTNYVTLGGAYKTSADTRFGLKGFYDGFNGKVATDDIWFKGVYDYQDLGVDANWSSKWETRLPLRTTLGVRGTQRKFPHYVSLDAEQRHEKDSNIARGYVDLELVWNTATPVFTTLSLAHEASTYPESLVVDDSGTTNSATRRRDAVTSLSLSLPIQGLKQSWELAYELEARNSNLNYFDSQDFTYIPDYNDYAEHTFVLSWGYNFERAWLKVLRKPQITLGASAAARVYDQRLAKDEKGDYTTAKEVDNVWGLNLGLNSPLSSFLAFFLKIEFKGHKSNNQDSGTSMNNYNLTTTQLGLQFAF